MQFALSYFSEFIMESRDNAAGSPSKTSHHDTSCPGHGEACELSKTTETQNTGYTDPCAMHIAQRKRALHSKSADVLDAKTFKKARYAWQVKNTRVGSSSGAGLHDNNNSEYCSNYDGDKSSLVSECNNTEMEWTATNNVQENFSLKNSASSIAGPTSSTSISDIGNRSSTHNAVNLVQRIRASQIDTYWKKEQLAKSIVDNAINKTLEELGICPNSENNAVSQQQRLESQSLSAAISSCGLQNRLHYRSHNLAPIIAHLTRVSESITHNILQSRYIMEHPGRHRTPPQTSDTLVSQATHDQQSINPDTLTDCPNDADFSPSDSDDLQIPSENEESFDPAYVSQNDLLTHAVNAAINEKGLSLGSPECLND